MSHLNLLILSFPFLEQENNGTYLTSLLQGLSKWNDVFKDPGI